ncbi:hypothetical protein Hanom_Chr15g01383671 [Helianthus anomalus]
MHIFQQGMKMGVFYMGCWKMMMSSKSCRSLCTLFLIQQICLFPSWVVVCLFAVFTQDFESFLDAEFGFLKR